METYLITGAGSGLGRALAHILSKSGFHILLAGRNAEKLSSVKKEIQNLGGKADILILDVTDYKKSEEKITEASSQFNLYGMINNAGIGHFGSFTDLELDHIEEMVQTNILGTIYPTKAILPLLQEKGEGHVLNIISTAGLRGKVNESVYVASKFAVRGFTESLQKEYEGKGIKFTAAYMGGMNTPFWEGSTHISDRTKLRTPDEVAKLIVEQMEKDEIIIESNK